MPYAAFLTPMKSLIMTHGGRGSGQQDGYSRQVFLAVWVINVYVNTEREATQQKCELSTSTIQAESETEGIWEWWPRKGIHTIGEKINAICLPYHAFPKYISAFLFPRQKLYWGTLSYCILVSPFSWLCSPNRTSLQSSTVHINISHFSCKDFRLVHNFNKRKLLFCSACSGNNTHTRTLGGGVGSHSHSRKWAQSWTDTQCVLQNISAIIR